MQSGAIRILGVGGLRGLADPAAEGDPSQWLVRLDSGEQVVVPRDLLIPRDDGSYYLPLSRAQLQAVGGSGRLEGEPLAASSIGQTEGQARDVRDTQLAGDERQVIPIVEERLVVERRAVETGRVRVRKVVREHEETVDEPLLRETVDVRSVPINQVVTEPLQARYEGETLIIPLVEEVLVVEKRLMLREEIHVTRRAQTVREPKQVTVRSEEVFVERVDPATGVEGGGTQLA